MIESKFISKKILMVILIVFIGISIVISGILLSYLSKVSDLEMQLNEKNLQISAFNSTIVGLNSQLMDLHTDLTQANDQIISMQRLLTDYQTSIDSYLRIVNLAVSEPLMDGAILSQSANQTSLAVFLQLDYAGYVIVYVESNSTSTYAQVIYDAFGVNYNQKITVGENGAAAFPVLPSEVEILIGNEETVDDVSGSVSIDYVY